MSEARLEPPPEPVVVPASAALPLRRWWLWERSARSLDRFRIAAGLALVLHLGPWTNTHTGGWAALHIVALALAGAVTVGIAARRSAALLYACLLALRTQSDAIGFEAHVLHVIALFLALMPVGHKLCLYATRKARARKAPPPERVSGVAASVLLLFTLSLYVTAGAQWFAIPASGAWLASAMPVIAIAFVLPGAAFIALGIALQLLAHGYLITFGGSLPAHLALAATALLFAGESPSDAPPTKRVIDAGAAVAIAFGLLWLFGAGGTLLGLPGAAQACRVLSDLGALPNK